MSDLSWFNPTPHAIAVYASRPLSPMAAQHSLPSGRYSLLEPDFHRLDRTSLRLAHSFNHLVGDGEQSRRNVDAECSGGFQIDDQLVLGRRLNRQIAWLLALEDAIDIAGRAVEAIERVGPVADQPAVNGEITVGIDRRQPEAGCESDDQVARRCRAAPSHNQAAIAQAREC